MIIYLKKNKRGGSIGERFQFYLISKNDKGKKHISAYHDQWVWGVTAVKYTKRLIDVLRNTDWKNMMGNEIDYYVQNILSLRWHKDNQYFFHNVSVEDMDYSPDRADTNHGCCILDITNLKKFKCSFFDEDGGFMPMEKFAFDYEDKKDHEDIKKVLPNFKDKAFDKLTEKDYQDLCGYMQELVKEQVVKKLTGD